MQRSHLLCVLFALVLSAGTAFSQAVNATLLGRVTDSTGGVIVNGKVTVTETNTRVSRTGETNASGNYSFPDLTPGQYTVTVEITGSWRSIFLRVSFLKPVISTRT